MRDTVEGQKKVKNARLILLRVRDTVEGYGRGTSPLSKWMRRVIFSRFALEHHVLEHHAVEHHALENHVRMRNRISWSLKSLLADVLSKLFLFLESEGRFETDETFELDPD